MARTYDQIDDELHDMYSYGSYGLTGKEKKKNNARIKKLIKEMEKIGNE